MDCSFAKLYFVVALMVVLSKTIHAQQASPHPDTISILSQYSRGKKTASRIKWTWQLPTSVKKAFDESQYKDWFIENMITYDSSGKTFYRFLVNNGNLLDSDHYDSFLKKSYLDISNTGVIVRKQFP